MKILIVFLSLILAFATNSFATCSSNNAYGVDPCSPSNSDSERRFKQKIWQQQHREKADNFFQNRLNSVRQNKNNWRNN